MKDLPSTHLLFCFFLKLAREKKRGGDSRLLFCFPKRRDVEEVCPLPVQ